MIVRLHNLSARVLQMKDREAVKALFVIGDRVEHASAEDLSTVWTASGFNLKTDAWGIVTRTGEIVGYAAVQRCEDAQLVFAARVHPAYTERGIETLLIWLVEERARRMMGEFPVHHRVTLSYTANGLNETIIQTLEREGYVQTRSFWRLLIEMEQLKRQPQSQQVSDGHVLLDFVIDTQQLQSGMLQTESYIARQYHVYEKELRAGMDYQAEKQGCELRLNV